MTYGDYVDLVLEQLSVDAQRRGLEDFRARMIRNALVDLQRYIKSYQTGHSTTYSVVDMVLMENAMRGDLPVGCIPHAFYTYSTKVDSLGVAHPFCNRNLLDFWPWTSRQHLICSPCDNRLYAYTLSPQNKTFIVHPILNDETTLLLIWQGIKSDFADLDDVSFPSESAEAVAAYVKWRILLEVDKNPGLAREMYAIWSMKRLALYRDEQEKQDAEKPDEEYPYTGGGWGGSSVFGGNGYITGKTAIVAGQQSYAILFSPPFSAAPSFFNATIQMPNSSGEISAVAADLSSLTKDGVTVWLAGVPTALSTGGFINWEAQL